MSGAQAIKDFSNKPRLWRLARYSSRAGVFETEMVGFVVRASSETEARRIASAHCGDEGEQEWLDDTRSSCSELRRSGPAGVIMKDCVLR